MSSTAFPWSFPYPSGGDRPADGAAAIEQLADRLDLHLTRWQADSARLRKRPAAYMTFEGAAGYTMNRATVSAAQFNTVQLDTAGMVDLNRRADRIFFPRMPRPAMYAVGATIVGRSVTAPTFVDFRLWTNLRYATGSPENFAYNIREQGQDRGDPWEEIFNCGGAVVVNSNVDAASVRPEELYMWLEINSPQEFNVRSAIMWAFWLTDL